MAMQKRPSPGNFQIIICSPFRCALLVAEWRHYDVIHHFISAVETG